MQCTPPPKMQVVPKVWMSELFYRIIHVSNSSLENVLSKQGDCHWLSLSTKPCHWLSLSTGPRRIEVIFISNIHERMNI